MPDAYYSPSLTCAMLMRRRIAIREALALLLIQSGSGLAAATLVGAMVGPRHLAVIAGTVKGCTLVAAFALELVFTFVLCYAAFDVTSSDSRNSDDYNSGPIVLGVMASAIAIGAVTNDGFDSRVTFDNTMLGILSWPTLWIYIVSQLLSGIAATTTYANLAEQP